MKQIIKTDMTSNHEKELKDKMSWRILENEALAKDKKDRKSFSNNKIISSSFLNNRLSRIKDNLTNEKNNSFNALGKAGSNIITNIKIPPHLKTNVKLNQMKIINTNNFTPKNDIFLNYKENKNLVLNDNFEIKKRNQNNSQPSNTCLNSTYEKPSDELKSALQLSIDQEMILRNLNLIEIWIDTDIAIDNKSLFSTILNKYLKEFSLEFFEKNFEILNQININKIYIKVIKLSLILIIIAKFVLAEFPCYEHSIKFQLKKLYLNVSQLYGLLYDIFIFDQLNSEVIDKKFCLIEKLKKIIKLPFANILNLRSQICSNINEILFQISKNIDNGLIILIKNFIGSYFNYGFYIPVFNVINEFIKQIDKLSIKKLVSLISECILYSNIKKEGNIAKVTQIEISMNPYNIHQQIQVPFLPPLNDKNKQYTLVLDLDETLVHFFYTLSGGTFFVRPYTFEFLNNLSVMYEIVIFTASMKEYADNILNLIDPFGNIFSHRLYRQHTSISEMGVSKDLSKLGRNLNKTIIVDNLPDNFKSQPNNGLAIRTWTDDMNDTELLHLMRIFKDIYMLKTEDIKIVIAKINEILGKSNPNIFSIYSEIDIMKF